MRRKLEMDLEFLPYLDGNPLPPEELQRQAEANDNPTINSWKETWLKNFKTNKENHGPFCQNHIGMQFAKFENRPCIVLGSGPSLENSIESLKKNKTIPVVSCLHNFHYLIDNEIKVDLWVSLDAGPVTIEEISEGGKFDHEYYIDKTKEESLALYAGTDPGLVKQWKGAKTWFNCGIPNEDVRKQMNEIEQFDVFVSSGGNVLGACTYIAKAFLGCNPICFGGADFCFNYIKGFHPWKSKYDEKLGRTLRVNDIFGNSVHTWQSYHAFKLWFDGVTIRTPGIWMNASEGGTLGAYPGGLIPSIRQITMNDFILMYNIHNEMKYQCLNPTNATEPGFDRPKVLF